MNSSGSTNLWHPLPAATYADVRYQHRIPFCLLPSLSWFVPPPFLICMHNNTYLRALTSPNLVEYSESSLVFRLRRPILGAPNKTIQYSFTIMWLFDTFMRNILSGHWHYIVHINLQSQPLSLRHWFWLTNEDECPVMEVFDLHDWLIEYHVICLKHTRVQRRVWNLMLWFSLPKTAD